MFKKDSQLSLEKRFSISFSVLIFSAFAFFLFLDNRPELINLINALAYYDNLSLLGYIINGIGWLIAILIGILGVSVGLLAAAAKKELILLIRQ